MNGACINRFASWFAYHLSNFQFRWGWDDWSIALKYEGLHPKTKFIAETLHYCLRLTYHAKVMESIPKLFQKLVPEQAKPKNKFAADLDENNDFDVFGKDKIKDYASALMTAFSQKCTPEEALEILNENLSDSMDVNQGSLSVPV